jgi:hypothetical protein
MLDLGLAGGKRRRKTVYGQSENEVLQKLSKLRAGRDRGLDLLAIVDARPVARCLALGDQEIRRDAASNADPVQKVSPSGTSGLSLAECGWTN